MAVYAKVAMVLVVVCKRLRAAKLRLILDNM